MMLRVLAGTVAGILAIWAALILFLTASEAAPDGTPAHPYPPVMATPGQHGPR